MASTLPQLLKAIQAGNAQEVKRILTYNPSLAHQKQARDGHTPLHVAAGTGNLAIVRELLQAGASCQETDANLEVPLHIACRQRNAAAVVKDLLSDAGRRSCLKALNREGATPLHVAVQAGLLDVAQLLVNAGAKVDATDRSGRTPLDYVDPRLPGLAELLEAGRQLTPSRPSAAGASGGPAAAAGSTVSPGYHKSHPQHPHGPQHQGYYHHLTGSTTGNKQRHKPGSSPHLPAVSSPAGALPGGAFNRGGAAAAAAAAAGGGGAGRTSPRGARRSSSTYSSWDTSPSQACGFHTPVHHRTGGGLGREASAPAVSHLFHSPAAAAAAEGSSASLASPKPPRHTHGLPPAAVAAAMAAMHQQQQQHRVVSPRRASSDWSSYGASHEHSGGSSAAQLPAAMVAAMAAAAEQAAEVHGPVRQRVSDTCGNAAAAAEAQQFAAAEAAAAAADSDMQHPQPAPAVASDSAGQGTAANPDRQQQQQHQLVAVNSSASLSQHGAAALQQQQMVQGPLQQQAPTGLPMVPSSYQAHAAASSAAVAAAAAGSSSYCRGPLSLAQPQMQAVSAAAAAGGPGSNAAAAAAAAGGSSVGVHYQQLAAATAACHQMLQHGNVSQLSAQRSSGSIGASSVTAAAGGDMTRIPMGPLRSARAAAAAAAAANDPTRVSFDRSTAAAGGSAATAAAGGGAVSGIPAYRGHNGHVDGVAAGGVEAGGITHPARRQSSSNSGMMQVGNSWIVTPEGSCGLLLGGPLGGSSTGTSHAGLTAARSSTGGGCIAATAAAAAAEGPAQEGGAIAGPVACSMEPPGPGTAPQSARSSTVVQQPAAAAAPLALAAERSHPAIAAAQQLLRQQQQLAGVAAAVAAGSSGGSSGPLQAPLLAQLGELSGKVSRLEDFVEAQLELIPDWQKALEVVQVVKRQADDHSHLLTEQDSKLATQADFVLELAGKVDGLGARLQEAQGAADRNGQQLSQLESQQTGLQEHLTQFEGQLAELTQQLTQQAAATGARAAAGEAQVSSMVSQLDDTHSRLNATTARLSILEASLESSAADIKQQLLEQQQAVAAATALATAAAERSTAATKAAANAAATAVAAAAAAGRGSSRGAAAASGGGSTAVPADPLAKQLEELRLQVGELSATVAGMSRASRVAAALGGSSSSRRHGDSGVDQLDGDPDSRALVPACEAGDVAAHTAAAAADAPSGLRAPSPDLGEGLLPFMESTGACLAAHEAQIESLQALVPKLDGVVAQRAQLINLTEQVAALQTAFNMVPHGSRSSSHGGGGTGAGGASSSSHLPGLLPIGPLAAHKAAADTLSLATSMVKLQGQMGQLTLAVEGLRDEWEEAAEGLQAEREAARRDWEAERARIGSAEGKVARLLSEQQVEFAERETRLMQFRAAAAKAEEAAHLAALQSQQQVAGQMAAMQAQQALMAQQLAATQASNEVLRAELAAVQGQLAATAAAQAAMAEAQAAATAADMRRSNSSLCEDLPAQRSSSITPAAAAATANDGSSSSGRRHSEAASPAAAAAALPVAGSNAATGGGCDYPRVPEACSPVDNHFLPGSSSMTAAPETAAGAAPAALAAAAAAAASDDAATRQPESSTAEPRPAELAVLGQQRLVSGSVFGPGYFGVDSDGSRRGSGSANGSSGRHTPASPCGSPSAGGLTAAAAVPGGAHAAAAVAAETALPRRRMTYDAVVAHAKSDRGNSYSSGMTDTFGAARSVAATTVGDCDGRRKLTWLAKVRQGSSKGKVAAAATGSAPAAADPAGDVGRHRAEQKALAAAAAKAEKKLRKQLEQQQREQAHAAAPAVGKRSAGGALFGRWSKQARKAPADGAFTPEAAVLGELPAASEAAGAANQEQRPGYLNSSSSRDVRAGASCDQLLPAAAARGGADAWPAPAAAVPATAAAEAGGKWRRLLGGRSAKP